MYRAVCASARFESVENFAEVHARSREGFLSRCLSLADSLFERVEIERQQTDGSFRERPAHGREFSASAILHDVDIAACERRGKNFVDMDSEAAAAEPDPRTTAKMTIPNTCLQIPSPSAKLKRETKCPRNYRNRIENVYSRINRRAFPSGSKRHG